MASVLKKAGLRFDAQKCKTHLKMSNERFKLLIRKKGNNINLNKREIAGFLKDGKEEKAQIRVEQVIREDYLVEAYEILELQCELLTERMRYIENEKTLPPDMEQTVCTIIWAADKSEITELSEVKRQLGIKYGDALVQKALENQDRCVNDRVMSRMNVRPPPISLVHSYMQEIAKAYNIEWEPRELPTGIVPLAASGYSVLPGAASGVRVDNHGWTDGGGGLPPLQPQVPYAAVVSPPPGASDYPRGGFGSAGYVDISKYTLEKPPIDCAGEQQHEYPEPPPAYTEEYMPQPPPSERNISSTSSYRIDDIPEAPGHGTHTQNPSVQFQNPSGQFQTPSAQQIDEMHAGAVHNPRPPGGLDDLAARFELLKRGSRPT